MDPAEATFGGPPPLPPTVRTSFPLGKKPPTSILITRFDEHLGSTFVKTTKANSIRALWLTPKATLEENEGKEGDAKKAPWELMREDRLDRPPPSFFGAQLPSCWDLRASK